jgi:hypothetical protein
MFGPGTLDQAMKRRSVYFQIKRSQLTPMMITFDAPDTLQSMGQRSSTTVAPQSLLLLNNPQIRAAARGWAKKLMALPEEEALVEAYRAALSRPPHDAELAATLRFLRKQTAESQTAGRSETALTDFCQALFGLNEFLYLD